MIVNADKTCGIENNQRVEGATGQLFRCIALRAGASSARCELHLQGHLQQSIELCAALCSTPMCALAGIEPQRYCRSFHCTFLGRSFPIRAYQKQYTQSRFSAFPANLTSPPPHSLKPRRSQNSRHLVDNISDLYRAAFHSIIPFQLAAYQSLNRTTSSPRDATSPSSPSQIFAGLKPPASRPDHTFTPSRTHNFSTMPRT